MNSKAKGSQGERELAAYLTAAGFPAHRNDQRYIGGAGNPDISAAGLEEYHIEVKRVERLNIGEAMQQAERDAAGRIPVVVHRRNRQPWLITLRLKDFLSKRDFQEQSKKREAEKMSFAEWKKEFAETQRQIEEEYPEMLQLMQEEIDATLKEMAEEEKRGGNA